MQKNNKNQGTLISLHLSLEFLRKLICLFYFHGAFRSPFLCLENIITVDLFYPDSAENTDKLILIPVKTFGHHDHPAAHLKLSEAVFDKALGNLEVGMVRRIG